MRIEIRLPSGAGATFEGERNDFDLFQQALREGTAFFAGASSPAGDGPPPDREDQATQEGDAQELQRRLDRVGATSDLERVTIFAQTALERGREGLDAALAGEWYSELGLPKPGNLRATLSDARDAGLLRSAKRGLWRPTTAGENFARHGIRRSAGRRTSRRTETASS